MIVVLVAVLALIPPNNAQSQTAENYTVTFLIFDHPDGNKTYELNLTIPQTLYPAYTQKNHNVFASRDFSKFVTPQVFTQVADTLWELYDNAEDFTNAVLTMVHQITYEETIPSRYPVETLVIGKGDCDLFAYIAASILEAGGINTVLLFYETQAHMQLGVDLGSAPVDARTEIFRVIHQNVPYYIAECTGSAWRSGWRVGECPENYQNVTVQVVPLTGMERASPGQISASLRELDPSVITLQVSHSFAVENTQITLSGQILPISPNENVTIRAQASQRWVTIATVPTQQDGKFNHTWTPPAMGPIKLQVSWTGNSQYSGASSDSYNMVVLPHYFIVVLIIAAVVLTIMLVVFVRLLRRKPQLSTVTSESVSQVTTNPDFSPENSETTNVFSEDTQDLDHASELCDENLENTLETPDNK